MQAQTLATRIFEVTAALQLTGLEENEEQEVEAYATLMETRAPWVAELTALKPQITPAQRGTPAFERIIQIIADITALDKAQLATIEQMQANMRDDIKEMKSGQKMTNAYNAYQDNLGVSYFDKKS